MNGNSIIALAWLAFALAFNSGLIAQQGLSRLLGYGGDAVPGSLAPQNLDLYEVDPGSGIGTPMPTPPPWTGSSSWIGETAYDPTNGRLFIYDQTLSAPGTLLTIDAASGALIHASTPPQILGQIIYESSTGRLLALACLGCPNTGGSSLVDVDPATGALTLIGSPPFLSNVYQPWSRGPVTAIDPVTHRLFMNYPTSPVIAWRLAVIDTLTGLVLSDTAHPCSPCTPVFWHIHFDTTTSQLYGFSRASPGGASAIVTIDPMTAVPTPVGVSHPIILDWPPMPLCCGSTIDAQRREFHLISQYAQEAAAWGPFRLFTFNMDTGEMIGDPLLPTWYQNLEVDTSFVPMKGRVTPSPSNLLVPGTTRALTFEALLHAGEFYVPFVSCTPGSFAVGNLTVPLAFDVCSFFYLTDPLSGLFFNLTPSGGLADVLGGGFGTGTVSFPNALLPTGISLDLRIGFLTLTSTLQWTGVHGYTVLHLRS